MSKRAMMKFSQRQTPERQTARDDQSARYLDLPTAIVVSTRFTPARRQPRPVLAPG